MLRPWEGERRIEVPGNSNISKPSRRADQRRKPFLTFLFFMFLCRSAVLKPLPLWSDVLSRLRDESVLDSAVTMTTPCALLTRTAFPVKLESERFIRNFLQWDNEVKRLYRRKNTLK